MTSWQKRFHRLTRSSSEKHLSHISRTEAKATRTHDVDVYVELAKEYPTFNNYQLADKLGVSEATVRRNLRAAGYRKNDPGFDPLPEFVTPPLDTPIEVIGPVGVAADWHLPLTDYVLANEMIAMLRDEGITTLGIPGDFFNMDGLSRYEGKQDTANLEREVYEGAQVMDKILDNFSRVVFTMGNHDIRIARALGFKLAFKSAISLLFGDIDKDKKTRLEISNLDYFWARPFTGAPDYVSTYVCHPENYSTTPLAVARELAGKFGSNVMTAHSHHAATGYAKNGVHWVCELGGLHNKAITKYLQKTNKFSNWVPGFAWIDELNKPHMHSEGWPAR